MLLGRALGQDVQTEFDENAKIVDLDDAERVQRIRDIADVRVRGRTVNAPPPKPRPVGPKYFWEATPQEIARERGE